jgi:hypothetical protein
MLFRLASLPTYPLDRLSRYEYAFWRQVAQILFVLDRLDHREPQERRNSPFPDEDRASDRNDPHFDGD